MERKKVFIAALVCFFVISFGTAFAQDIMVWNPRTPAGGAPCVDPAYWIKVEEISHFGERALNLSTPQNYTTNYSYTGGTMVVGGETIISTNGSAAFVRMDLTGSGNSTTISTGK